MANAPPTPPATTPAELQDAAQANLSIAETSASVPLQSDVQIRPEVYQTAVPAIGEAIAQKDYERLIQIAEETDFIVCFLVFLLIPVRY